MLKLNHLYKTFSAEKPVLRDIHFELSSNSFYFLTGPSGCGKTTLFKLIIGIEKPTSGQILFNDKSISAFSVNDIARFRQKVGIIFQDGKLISDYTVAANILLPLAPHKISTQQKNYKLAEISELLDIKDLLQEYPEYLSGGQQQRIAVARALIHNPELIIADEPTGNLDKQNARTVVQALIDAVQLRTTVLFATHDESLISPQIGQHLSLQGGQLRVVL